VPQQLGEAGERRSVVGRRGRERELDRRQVIGNRQKVECADPVGRPVGPVPADGKRLDDEAADVVRDAWCERPIDARRTGDA
jgi:hypothetical protein